MGRMKRQKRYKACDPFSKNKQKVGGDDKYNLPPKGKAGEFDDHFLETKSFKKFQQTIQVGKMKQQNKLKSKEKTCNNEPRGLSKNLKYDAPKEPKCKKFPHETNKQYMRRLDQNIQDAVNTAMLESKTLRKKRKLHLKNRSEKKKMKKQSNVDASDMPLKDTVKFGETVDAPPTISIAPRKARLSGSNFQDLKLTSLLENVGKTKKIQKIMNKSEKESLDIERKRAIDAYRLMKKRKNIATFVP